MLDRAPTGPGFLGLMALYVLCLAAGFGLKGLSRLLGTGPRGSGAPAAAAGAPAPGGAGIARKFKVFFLFQTLMLTLAYWWLPGLALFFLALFAFSAREIAALQRRPTYPAGYGFRFGPAYGLLGLFGFSLFSFLIFSGRAAGRPFPPGGGLPFLAFVFLLLAVADGYAQITGQILGGPKIVPGISPGKTWSGFLGGMVFSAAVSALGNRILFGFMDAPRAAALGAMVGVLAFLGDISASWVKRRMGLKDFSDLLGPQGGILDRGDSLIWLGPALWLAWEAKPLFFRFLENTGIDRLFK
jgi:CDP-diglyceride synthetase